MLLENVKLSRLVLSILVTFPSLVVAQSNLHSKATSNLVPKSAEVIAAEDLLSSADEYVCGCDCKLGTAQSKPFIGSGGSCMTSVCNSTCYASTPPGPKCKPGGGNDGVTLFVRLDMKYCLPPYPTPPEVPIT